MKDTSLKAYMQGIKNGTLNTQETDVFEYIKEHPGLTRLQISEKMDIPINAICGRVNKLLKKHYIVEGEPVKQHTGKLAHTLSVAELEEVA